MRVLNKKVVGRPDVGKCARPASAIVADAPVFQIGSCQSPGGERGTEMPGMIKIVSGAPVAAVDVDDQRMRRRGLSFGRKTQVEKLIGIGAVREANIGLRRLPIENVTTHGGHDFSRQEVRRVT